MENKTDNEQEKPQIIDGVSLLIASTVGGVVIALMQDTPFLRKIMWAVIFALIAAVISRFLYKYFPNAPKPELVKNSLYMDKVEKCLYLDIKKIQTKLQWSLKYSVEDGLKEILQSHLITK